MGRDKVSGLYLINRDPPIDLHHVGLMNLGNSCFYNVICQALSATTAINDAVHSPLPTSPTLQALIRNHDDELPTLLSPLPISTAFVNLMLRLSAPPPSDTDARRRALTYNPRMLLRELSLKHEEYSSSTQEDCHELLLHLFDGVVMEEVDLIKKVYPPVKRIKRRSTLVPGSVDESSSDSEDDSESDSSAPPSIVINDSALKPRPFIDSIFAGRLTSVIVCSECAHVSLTTEDFLDLSLSIKNDAPTKVRKRDKIRKTLQASFFSSQKASYSEAEASPSASEAEEEEESTSKPARRKSVGELRRPFWSRSTSVSREPSPSRTSTKPISRSTSRKAIPKPTPEQERYAQSLLREIPGPTSTLPLQLRWAVPPSSNAAPSSSSSSSSSTSTASTDLHACLRQFTAVEMLEGDNLFACKKCWKLLNPVAAKERRQKRKRRDTMRPEEGGVAWTAPSLASIAVSPIDENGSLVAALTTLDLSSTSSVSSTTSTISSSVSATSSLSAPLPLPSSPPLHRRTSSLSSSSSRPTTNGEFGELTDDDEGDLTDTSFNNQKHGPKGVDLLTTANVLALTPTNDTYRSNVPIASKPPTKPVPKAPRVVLRKAHKRYLLSSPPPALVIHFKRFEQRSSSSIFGSSFTNLKKIDTFLSFPLDLDLTPFLAPPPRHAATDVVPISAIYRLYAVVVHVGSLGTGHYSCYFLSDRYASTSEGGDEEDRPKSIRRWMHASDEAVRTCSADEVLKCKAYMLFYERVDGEVIKKSKI